MASAVATPLERQFGHIAGVSEMTSQSSIGTTSITLQFDLDRNINAAARDVEAAISQARNYLPTDLPSNPTYRKMNSAEAPIAIISVASKSYDVTARYEAASNILLQRLSQTPGVGQVQIGGGALPAVRVETNPLQLEHYGITLSQVATFLKNQNAHTPTGSITEGNTVSYIRINDQLSRAADYRPLVLAVHNGSPVRLQDVATVIDSTESTLSAGYANGLPSVDLIIFKQAGSNIVDTVDLIKAELPTLQASIPSGMTLTFTLDRTTTIRASLHDVERTLLISIVLVILVVFVFLRNWRATLIPGISVPVSLIGTFAAMYLLNYSLDNLSLMALTISTGFVIDDAIVVMENITRHIENGMPVRKAVFQGADEIGFTVVSMSLSLIAVFIPILMMGGIVGRLFREFAMTLAVAITISMMLSLTTTPMLCALLLKDKGKEEKHGRLYNLTEAFFNQLRGVYERSLRWVIRDHPALVLLLFIVTAVMNILYLTRIPSGFFPQQDNGLIMGGFQGTQDASFKKMNASMLRATNIITTDPGVKNVVTFAGGRGASNSGFAMISLKPLEERKVSSTEIVDRLRGKLSTIKEVQTFLMAAQDLRVGGRQSNAQYQYTVKADTTNELKQWVPLLTREIKKMPDIADVNSDLQTGGLDTYLTFDRDTAARLGLTATDIDNTLNYSFSQAQASTIYKTLNQYHVVLEADPRFTQYTDTLDSTYVGNGSGAVPLSAISNYTTRTAPLSVNHTGLYPSSTISFNLAPGITLGKATEEINALESHMGIPKSVHGTFTGTAQVFQKSLESEPLLILTAILAVYIVLGILYESYVHPITILTTLPSASLGAAITLTLFNSDLNVISLIGIILLIGLVKKNAIMMIDFALQLEREKGMNTKDAIFEACVLRFRPILMTTASAFFGAVPLAFGTGIGSELRRPLGLTIMGGLAVSQVLTLYTTPILYLYLDRVRLYFGGKRNHGKITLAPQESL
jgi:multidrug efflux pump